ARFSRDWSSDVCSSDLTGVALLAGGAVAQSSDWRTVSPENLWVIDTAKGRILVELEPRAAPNHIERIRTLTNQGFYDGLKFHRRSEERRVGRAARSPRG